MRPHFIWGVVRLGCGLWVRPVTRPVCRACSGCARAPLERWSVEVSALMRVRCHVHCDVSVRAVDPHACPAADRALISVYGVSGGEVGLVQDTFHVDYDRQSRELRITADESNSHVSVELSAPVKSDLHVVTRGKGTVKIQNMESDLCQVQTESGQCVLHSIKSHKVQVKSRRGSITTTGTIHGDVDISTAGHSSIDINKIQGTAMRVTTEHGTLTVKTIYAESSSVASSSGRIHIGHMHGEAHVQSDTGDVIIDSSNGALTVETKTGNIDAYVGQTGSAKLHTQQGAVCVRVPSTIKAEVQLRGTSVEVSPEISQETEHSTEMEKTVVTAQLNGGTQEQSWIQATADRGAVRLKTQSWFETLRLGS